MNLLSISQQFDVSRLRLAEQRIVAELAKREETKALEQSLIAFFEAAWPAFDPAPFAPGWHLEAIAEHLEAVTAGDIRRLLINVPPRCTKTSLVSIAWPAWIWAQSEIGPLSGPQVKFMCLSYASPLSLEIATTARRLIQSDWYQSRWGKRVQIVSDQDSKAKFDTSAGGSRISASFGGSTLGRGGDIRIIDDPHKVDEVESEVTQEGVIREYDEALATRVTDPKTSAEVAVMQRLHERDLAGHILSAEDPDLVHLCLPMEYDPGRHCVTVLDWEDPRSKEGELLWPGRFDRPSVQRWKTRLGPYASAGQLQQAPVPRGGGIFKREWWRLWESPDGKFPLFEYIVASLDSAFTEKEENDPSGFTVWGIWTDAEDGATIDKSGKLWRKEALGRRKVMLLHAWRKHLEMHGEEVARLANETDAVYFRRAMPKWGLVEHVAHTCRRFKVDRLLIEAKVSGITAAQEMRRLYGNETWSTDLVQVIGDKVARAHAVVPAWSQGLIYAPDREWSDLVIDEMATFPKGRYKDLTDSATQAIKHLRQIGLIQHEHERRADEQRASGHRKKRKALYPA